MVMEYNFPKRNLFQRLFRKIRWYIYDKRAIREGWVYHHHMGEIVVSKHELKYQLFHNHTDNWDTLLRLLTYGKACPDYETALLMVSLKFAYLGRLIYPISKVDAEKLTHKEYAHYLFEGYYETLDEVKKHIARFYEKPVSAELAKRVFKKLLFIINTCCPLMADCAETWCYHTYYSFVEYAIEHDNLGVPECNNMWDAYPKHGIPRGSVRNHLLKDLPEEFTEKVCYTNYHGFRFDKIVEGL